ncbi:TetR/AcrR family transcriptional regulator [Lentisphaerota bacterium ZTH]|nr:TetR/AcrR family transcriptional regulator [Lentisphaerota bacterium]WET06840.1 TetR/AcrR family transcriptional regulator [Lentisphaerota bacterium ZTH]
MKTPDKKKSILEAVEKLGKTNRFHEIKLDKVASTAKVGKGTIYLYFKDKNDLFQQVALNGLSEVCDMVAEDVQSDLPFEQKLTAVSSKISSFFISRTSLMNLLREYEAQAGLPDKYPCSTERKRLFDLVLQILQQGQQEGKVRKDIELPVQAVFLLGMLRTRDHVFRRHHMPIPEIDTVIDLYLRGITTR